MLSIVIPTYNSAADLPETVQSLVPPPYVREIIIVDGGSEDQTCSIAQQCADQLIRGERGRGQQMKAGAQVARGDWLLFLHSDTRLPEGWGAAVSTFMAMDREKAQAAYFTFALDDEQVQARRLEKIVSWRCRFLGLPYGDQGLLISRTLYEQVGGFHDLPLMEDVDMVRRIGKSRLRQLPVKALTSARKYQKRGYMIRSLRNVACLSLYFLGLSPARIAKLYG
ncbi:TIGR04283 family arsenosugar biosynthesis glycosyltransferase [Terasakiella sp. SH-1]|uniref:TIGR04283 family arsenosugar biosynthesis glycosyltransferase n=1 Tax=Terasakiella sp. SH-1 TaxID=2560057 RepID=UPI001072F924|nr:TIGR04283 family arsenosugar biosynthesis glycosyltransferase [Terasakiella sp. SH-1]